jgi:hypothetical protein
MKNYSTIILSVMLLFSVGVSAQTALPKGQSQLNFGVGFSDRGFRFILALITPYIIM